MTSNNAPSAGAEHLDGGAGDARRPRYTLRPVVKPLPSQVAEHRGSACGMPAGARAENEDDDGYDPYSDYHDGNAGVPSFEEDPWR